MDVEECLKEWDDLVADYKRLESINKDYAAKLEEVGELQASCMKELNHQRYRMNVITGALKRLEKKGVTKDERVANLEKEVMKRKAMLHEIEATLPKQNSMYLRIILGNVNVSILNKNDKFKYKDEYEKFKLILSVIAFVLAVLNLYIDFRIKGWWRLHHFISTAVAGVVQYMQFRYQSGVLYRLKALGARHNMDITIEGFHSWMWRGLSYLLPFLFGGYVFQLYIAYTLYQLSYHPEATWQVPNLAVMFLVLHSGNMYTILRTMRKKTTGSLKLRYKLRAIAYRLSNELTTLISLFWIFGYYLVVHPLPFEENFPKKKTVFELQK
ncbi:hypothetical protein MSG28_010343 [Choristoneura fumiferana]|uniref:Uncharacterized protein n=1 Tax=Choristoneura fumiferana TaxID=7141 RepID=A0ACC0KK13_CHOFU|nr:hypothetical protein MSG28_010343 [Choristoneura fumiferana]